MSSNTCNVGSGSRSTMKTFEFGRTHVVRPKGQHQATIVWLHGLGDKGSRLGHYSIPEETNDLCNWLIEGLQLEGS